MTEMVDEENFLNQLNRFNGAQGRNRIVYDAIELEPFFESLFSSVPVNVPALNSHAQSPLRTPRSSAGSFAAERITDPPLREGCGTRRCAALRRQRPHVRIVSGAPFYAATRCSGPHAPLSRAEVLRHGATRPCGDA